MSPIISSAISLLMLALVFYYSFVIFPSSSRDRNVGKPNSANGIPTEMYHLVFGLLGTEKACHHRKAYMESWWRPNEMRGYLFLDEAPAGDLLPWSSSSPPYRISNNLTEVVKESNPAAVMTRLADAIEEIIREYPEEGFRWLVMGDDDTIFFVENILDVLAKYDHKNYHYFSGQTESVLSNFRYSFNMGSHGAGYIFSYPLAKALARDMDSCLRRYDDMNVSDLILMACVADFGVTLSPQKGMHQIDLRGNLTGFLSSHTKSLLMSLHHFDEVEPIFPTKDRFESTRHLMKAADLDQSRLLQQTICHDRHHHNWSVSISWGYSAHIYENIFPRTWLQLPIETFEPLIPPNPNPPHFMLNARPLPGSDSCKAPHVFYFDSIDENESKKLIVTSYSRSAPRELPPCLVNGEGNNSADFISHVYVHSPSTRRTEIDRSECCDITYGEESKNVIVRLRECIRNEVIA